MHTIITNGRFSNLNSTTGGHAREELRQRVRRNHRFTVKSSALSWFNPRYYLWLMYHTIQGELNLMGFGPRPLTFAGFMEDPHFQELYARAWSMIESHKQISKEELTEQFRTMINKPANRNYLTMLSNDRSPKAEI